jgi:hypothetical protein
MNDSLESDMRGTIRGQSERIRKLEDSRTFWLVCFVCMTAACIVLTALKCQH